MLQGGLAPEATGTDFVTSRSFEQTIDRIRIDAAILAVENQKPVRYRFRENTYEMDLLTAKTLVTPEVLREELVSVGRRKEIEIRMAERMAEQQTKRFQDLLNKLTKP
jgi:ribose 1,5-bisphosphokinase PhnN